MRNNNGLIMLCNLIDSGVVSGARHQTGGVGSSRADSR